METLQAEAWALMIAGNPSKPPQAFAEINAKKKESGDH